MRKKSEEQMRCLFRFFNKLLEGFRLWRIWDYKASVRLSLFQGTGSTQHGPRLLDDSARPKFQVVSGSVEISFAVCVDVGGLAFRLTTTSLAAAPSDSRTARS